MAKATPAVPIEIRRVYRSFERWRRTRKGRELIPEPLWTSAAELAKEHGVFRTAQVLHLDSCKLKRRVESTVAVTRRPAPGQAFVGPMAPAAMGVAEYDRTGRAARQDARLMERDHAAGPEWTEPGVVGASVIQLAPQMRILVVDRAGRWSQRHRFAGASVPGEASGRSFLRLRISVSQPARYLDPRPRL
jgi:hypothetical protein